MTKTNQLESVRRSCTCWCCGEYKDQGLLLCWPCHDEARIANSGTYGPHIEARLAEMDMGLYGA